MDFWTHNGLFGGLAHVKSGRSGRESVDQRLPRRWPEHGLWDE